MDYNNLNGKWNKDKKTERIILIIFSLIIISAGVIL